MKPVQIGQLLVEHGVLNETQIAHLLTVQKSCHRPIGDLAERLYGVSPKAIEDAWVEQYLRISGITDLEEQRIDADCLRLINRRQAWQFRVLPTNRDSGELNIATDADNLVRAVNFANRRLNEPILFLIAERQQLREFLQKNFPVPSYFARLADAQK